MNISSFIWIHNKSIFIIYMKHFVSLWRIIQWKDFLSIFMLDNLCWKEVFRLLIVRFAPVKYYNFAGMNGERIFFSDQNLSSHGMVEGTNTHYEQLFKSFLHNFSRENTRVYHKRLETQIRNRKFVLPI